MTELYLVLTIPTLPILFPGILLPGIYEYGSLQLCQQNMLESHNEKMDGRTDCVLCKGRDEEETKITDDILSGTVNLLFFSYRVKYPVK